MNTQPQDIVDSADSESGTQPLFAHLHLHSEYSLLDGGNTTATLVKRVKELGMDSVAVTDHGNLHGVIEFYLNAKKENVKPILGIEAYVAPTDRTVKQTTGLADGGFHLVLLAENNVGWRNLIKLSSDSFLTGFYYKPRMDKSTLAQWCDGLIAINGHIGSSIAHHLTQFVQTGNEAHYKAAIEEAQWHAQTFKPTENGEPRFYLELQRTSVPEQERINPLVIKLAKELNLPLVADNDVHYLLAEDHDTHDSLCCISTGKFKDDTSRLQYSREIYLKSPQQMAELFSDVPEALENSARIANRCNVELYLESYHVRHAPLVKITKRDNLPVYSGGDRTEWFNEFCAHFELHPIDPEEARTKQKELADECDRVMRELCEAGLMWRYGPQGSESHTDEIRQRLDREIEVISGKNISAYFLIVWDFVNWARQRGIPAGARGSGVGTMVGYTLGLSNACPVRYGLLFERFTDPDRSEYPDIDIDICQDGRAEVINYVRQKYGHVAQIITFGRLKARAAIKDVARVNGLTPAEGQRLANLIPNELNITIDASLQKEPDFKHEYDSNPVSRRVIDSARALEHHARHAGVHAAGVVIATQPLENIVPLCKTSGNDDVVTQWDGPTCERVGLLKMDFLGLRTLSIIELARQLIREELSDEAIYTAVGRSLDDGGAHPLDLDRLSYDDQRVFDLFRRADTAGIFQFESGGMRRLLIDMQPDRLEDLIAANALFRPGPMELIPEYCRRKHGAQPVPVVHPIVDGFTSETYGIMVYQEQVMQIVHELGDIPLRAAYTLIKAISKKKSSVIDAERPKFIEGAKQKGLLPKQANELFDLILKFAGYGFNKSHSSGYAIIAYHTAYLKTYFPNQYMAALLTYESGAQKIESWTPLLEECKRVVFPDDSKSKPHVGVEVRPPDINVSDTNFSVVFDENESHDAIHGHVRFGLSAIKGIGKGAIQTIVAERDKNGPFKSIFEFCERISSKTIGRAHVESLVKCGAFDSVHGADQRAAMAHAIEDAIAAGQSAADDRRSGQLNIFATMADESAEAKDIQRPLPKIPPWDDRTKLTGEKECLGFHVSGHPLDPHETTLHAFATHMCAKARHLPDETPVVLGGQFTRVNTRIIQRGQNSGEKMAVITLQDKTGSLDGVAFSDAYKKFQSLIGEDALVMCVGRLDRKRGEPQIIIDQVFSIQDAPQYLASKIEIDLASSSMTESLDSQFEPLADLLEQLSHTRPTNGGRTAEVFLRVPAENSCVTLRMNRVKLIPDASTLERIGSMVGMNHVRVTGGGVPKMRNENGNGRNRFTPRHSQRTPQLQSA